MHTNRISWKLLLPVAGLVLAALACALPAGLGDGSFTDDFSSSLSERPSRAKKSPILRLFQGQNMISRPTSG